MQPHVTAVYLVGFAICLGAILLALYRALITRQKVALGWNKIEPGSFHWIGLVCGFIWVVFSFGAWLFAPPEEPYPEFTHRLFYWFGVFGALLTIYIAYWIGSLKKRNLRWRESTIQQTGKSGSIEVYFMAELVSYKTNAYHEIELRFQNGRVITIDPYMKNFYPFVGVLGNFAPKLRNQP